MSGGLLAAFCDCHTTEPVWSRGGDHITSCPLSLFLPCHCGPARTATPPPRNTHAHTAGTAPFLPPRCTSPHDDRLASLSPPAQSHTARVPRAAASCTCTATLPLAHPSSHPPPVCLPTTHEAERERRENEGRRPVSPLYFHTGTSRTRVT